MAWNEAVITDEGIALLAKTFTEGDIVLTYAEGGEGYTEGSRLTSMTEIEPPLHELGLAGIRTEKGRITVKVHGQNNGVLSRYTLRQIGIFAKEKSAGGGDILFAVIQDKEGEVVPPVFENPEYLLEFDFVIPISNAENIEVVVSSGLFALQAGVENMIKRLDIVIPHENWNVQSEGVLCLDIPLSEVTEEMTPVIAITSDSLAVAKACGLSTACESLEGKLRVYSQQSPDEDIRAALVLLSVYDEKGADHGTGNS